MIVQALLGKFRGHSLAEFRKWTEKILEHLIRHRIRFWSQKKRDRKREQPLAPGSGGPDQPAGTTTSILGQIVRAEELEQLQIALGWCRDEDRAVIFQHLDERRSHEEVAAELRISIAAARKRYSRAIRSVSEAMNLLELMTGRGVDTIEQEIIGLHHFQKADPPTIAKRLCLPEQLVTRCLSQAAPLIRELAEAKS